MSQRTEVSVPGTPGIDAPLFVRIGSERLQFRTDPEEPSVLSTDWGWCVAAEVPSADIPAAYLEDTTMHAGIRGVWFEEGQGVATVFATSFPRRFHAEQRNHERTLNGVSLVFQNPQGRRHGFGWRGRGEVVRLSSGVFVVQPPKGERVERIVTHPYFAWGGREAAEIQGPFIVGPDGVPRRFRTRLWAMAGWGDNRLWGLSADQRTLIGTDRDGRVFFRRRLGGSGLGVMPFRDGVCVATEPSGVRCFNLARQQTADLDVPGATTFAVDADGRIFAGGPSRVSAFAPDGSRRWEDSVPDRSGHLVLSPGLGLCTARRGNMPSVVCYGAAAGAETSAEPSL